MPNLPFTFTKRNLFFLLACIAGITLLVVAIILPTLAENRNLSLQIPQIKEKISSQRELATLLTTYDLKLKQLENLTTLPDVPVTSLDLTKSNIVITDLTDIARQLNLSDIEINAIIPESCINLQEISFSSSLKGKITNLHSYIYELLQVPYVSKIKKLEIKSAANTLNLELIFTVRLS